MDTQSKPVSLQQVVLRNAKLERRVAFLEQQMRTRQWRERIALDALLSVLGIDKAGVGDSLGEDLKSMRSLIDRELSREVGANEKE